MTKHSFKWAPRPAHSTQINCGEVKRGAKSVGGEVQKQGEEKLGNRERRVGDFR